MLKVIPVKEAVGMRLAHDITEIIPGKHTEEHQEKHDH